MTSAQEQIQQAEDKVTTYENLIKAYAAFQSGNHTSAANVLQNVNSDLLSVDAKEIYDSIYANVKSTMKKEMKTQGEVAFYQKDYTAAIDSFKKALELDDTDGEVWNLLAHSYRMSGDFENAKETFQSIIDKFPGTKRASTAQKYIDNEALMKSGVTASGPSEPTGDAEGANGNQPEGDTEGANGNLPGGNPADSGGAEE